MPEKERTIGVEEDSEKISGVASVVQVFANLRVLKVQLLNEDCASSGITGRLSKAISDLWMGRSTGLSRLTTCLQ